jgi:hypothetical protein
MHRKRAGYGGEGALYLACYVTKRGEFGGRNVSRKELVVN